MENHLVYQIYKLGDMKVQKCNKILANFQFQKID